MIISFSVENYRSIKHRATIDLTEVGRLREHVHTTELEQTGDRVLPVLAIYGANASGKSNLLKSLAHIIAGIEVSAERGPSAGIPNDPFRLTENVDPISHFAIKFSFDGEVYDFEISHDSKIVIFERLRQKGERSWRLLYERKKQEFRFGKNLSGRNSFMSEITRPNSFFLSVAASNNHPVLSGIYSKIVEGIKVRDNPNWLDTAKYIASLGDSGQSFRNRVVQFLKAADLGISDLSVRKNELSDKEIQRLQRVLKAVKEPDDPDDDQIDFSDLRAGHYEEEFLMSGEQGAKIPLSGYEQSTGTQHLWGMAGGILHALDTGSAIVIDEIERSLHPVIAQKIVEQFTNPETNKKGAQLLFTSHSLSVLSTPSLPRSAVWFCEKDQEGHSEFYPLSEFRTRVRDDISKGYMQGRFGAIPFVEHLVK